MLVSTDQRTGPGSYGVLCPSGGVLPFPLIPWGLAIFQILDSAFPSAFAGESGTFHILVRRYGRRSGQPSSLSLVRRACVHSSGLLTIYCTTPLVVVLFNFGYWDTLNFASAPGLFGGRGEMAMAVASSARLAFQKSLRGLRRDAVHQMLSL